jgi:hypothetical protein
MYIEKRQSALKEMPESELDAMLKAVLDAFGEAWLADPAGTHALGAFRPSRKEPRRGAGSQQGCWQAGPAATALAAPRREAAGIEPTARRYAPGR